MKDKKLSVIIPLYNVEAYIAKAAESIARQTFDGLEVIVVDDGSTDRSLEVCAEHLHGVDAKFIRQNNAGPGDARNTGIFEATGEYIMFVDADDFLLPNAFESILSALDAGMPDVLFGRYLKWTPETGFIKSPNYDYKPTGDQVAYILNNLPESSWNIWRYVCRRRFIMGREIFFESGTLFEDVPWILEVLDSAEMIAFCKEPFYAYYLRRTNSIMNNMPYSRLVDLNQSIGQLLNKYEDRPGICDALVWQSFLYINEYRAYPDEQKAQIFDSYMSILPQYSLSSSKLSKIAVRCRNKWTFEVLSWILYQAKRIRRLRKYGEYREKTPSVLPSANDSGRAMQEV